MEVILIALMVAYIIHFYPKDNLSGGDGLILLSWTALMAAYAQVACKLYYMRRVKGSKDHNQHIKE